jgi:hypothetical protein
MSYRRVSFGERGGIVGKSLITLSHVRRDSQVRRRRLFLLTSVPDCTILYSHQAVGTARTTCTVENGPLTAQVWRAALFRRRNVPWFSLGNKGCSLLGRKEVKQGKDSPRWHVR